MWTKPPTEQRLAKIKATMLPGPAMDTFEARPECRADKLTLTRGRERSIEQWSKEPGSSRTLRSLPLVIVNLSAQHSSQASKVSMVGPSSMISEFGWLAFFESELWSVRCRVEFGLEFNWKGALNPVQWFYGEIGSVGWISVGFFFASSRGQSRIECAAFTFS